MKHCVIFFVFMVGCLYSSAQDLECGIEYSEEEVQGLMTERMNILKSNSNNVAYFPIQHHIVRRADGTGGISESSIVQVEKALNEKFIDANIQFYSCNEIEYIYSDIYYDLIKNLEDESLRLAHNCPTAINIYYFGSVRKENGNSLAGYSCLAPASSNFIAIAMNYATNGTIYY
ncbi:MAG: hypothetical protein MJ197_03475 [Bacteroidales bacterium]|nr:hypothetical protein [Bacteroidales bacterium]